MLDSKRILTSKKAPGDDRSLLKIKSLNLSLISSQSREMITVLEQVYAMCFRPKDPKDEGLKKGSSITMRNPFPQCDSAQT